MYTNRHDWAEIRRRVLLGEHSQRAACREDQLHAQAGGGLRQDHRGHGQRRQHVSPIEWDNVILYGQYVLDRAQVR